MRQKNPVNLGHRKYDKGEILFQDVTTGETVFQRTGFSTANNGEFEAYVHLKEDHNYSVRLIVNCSNVSAACSFSHNVYNPDVDKYNYPYGGLRIKEISNYDNAELLEKTVFTYQQPAFSGRSSGYITNNSLILQERSDRSFSGYTQSNMLFYCLYNETLRTLYYDNPITGIYPDNIAYEYVQVSKYNPSGQLNGITRYKFSTKLDHIISKNVPIISNSSLRGKLLQESIYNSNGELLEESFNYYTEHPLINDKSRGFKLTKMIDVTNICATPPSVWCREMYIPEDYTYYSYWCKLDSTIKHSYFNNAYVKDRVDYVYDDIISCLPTSIINHLNEKRKITNYQYPSSGRINRFIMKEEKMDAELLMKQINMYSSKEVPNNLLGLELNSTIRKLDSVLVQYGNDLPETQIRITKHSDNNNILESQTNAGLFSVYIWGYNNQYLLAKIEDFTYAQLTGIINENTLKEIANKNMPSDYDIQLISSIRSHPNAVNALITTYTYKPLIGIISVTDYRGKSTYFNYDGAGRLIDIYEGTDQNKKILEHYQYNFKNKVVF